MKFQKYIIEANEISTLEILTILERDCKPFIKDFVATNQPTKFLYRGVKGSNKSILKKTVRSDRRPLDMANATHRLLNEYFEDKFGIPLRSKSAFVNPNYAVADNYGRAYIFFPIGKYEIYWSDEIKDLYNHVSKSPDTIYFKSINRMSDSLYNILYKKAHNDKYVTFDEWKEKYIEEFDKKQEKVFKKLVDKYKKGDLRGALLSNNEIMVTCKEYYLIPEMYITEFIKYFDNYKEYRKDRRLMMSDFGDI